MVDKRITDFGSIVALADTDVLEIVDVSDTTDDVAGSSFKVSLATLLGHYDALTATMTNKILTLPKIDTIEEATSNNGITIDSVILKDGSIIIRDNARVAWGASTDWIIVQQVTGASPDAVVVGVFKDSGSNINHQGYTGNSLILSAITDDTDILMAANDAGSSKEFLHVDGSEAALTLGHGMAAVDIKASGDITLTPGTNVILPNGKSLTVDTIAETTGAVGVTIDGVLLKDSAIAGAAVPSTHSGSAHHTKYTDAEAITAVEGEATLDLAGDITTAAGKFVVFGHTAQVQVGSTQNILGILAADNTAAFSIARWGENAFGSHLAIGKSRGATVGSIAILQDGDQVGLIDFAVDDGTDLVQKAALILVTVDDASPAANQVGGKFTIQTAQTGGGRPAAFIIDSSQNVGLPTDTPLAKLHVDQASLTAAIPTLFLDQADLSEEMIELNTTIGTGNPIEAIAAKTLTTTHFVKVTIPGGLTRYFPVGTIA